jgi:hypothetical protein
MCSTTDPAESRDVSKSQITGTIPPELFTLPQIQVFSIENAPFYGTIPSSIGSAKTLLQLYVAASTICMSLLPANISSLTLSPSSLCVFVFSVTCQLVLFREQYQQLSRNSANSHHCMELTLCIH